MLRSFYCIIFVNIYMRKAWYFCTYIHISSSSLSRYIQQINMPAPVLCTMGLKCFMKQDLFCATASNRNVSNVCQPVQRMWKWKTMEDGVVDTTVIESWQHKMGQKADFLPLLAFSVFEFYNMMYLKSNLRPCGMHQWILHTPTTNIRVGVVDRLFLTIKFGKILGKKLRLISLNNQVERKE